ncbi:hypothetical protein Tco_1064278 [Tanacetum coccineum]
MDTKFGVYSFQLDELWFTLDVDLLRNALGITPKDFAYPFVAPPAGDLVIDFVNNLGYPEELQFVSKMYVNSLYQPWRTILSMINQCLTGKTSGSDRPRHPAIKTFFTDTANLKVPNKKPKPYVIPYCQFTKLIICYLGGELDEVFEMDITKDLITDVICNSEYYQKYLDMASRKPRQAATVIDEEGGKKKAPPAVKKKPSKPTPSKKIRKGKRSDHLVDEADEEPLAVSEPQVEDDEYNLQKGIQMTLETFQAPVGGVAIHKPNSGIIQKLLEVEGKGKGIISDEQAAQSLLDLQKPKKKNTTDQYIFHRRTPATQDASTDTKIFNDDKEHSEEVSYTVALEERTVELDKGQAGSDLGKTPES